MKSDSELNQTLKIVKEHFERDLKTPFQKEFLTAFLEKTAKEKVEKFFTSKLGHLDLASLLSLVEKNKKVEEEKTNVETESIEPAPKRGRPRKFPLEERV